ncbi:ABC-type branched-subunit amino acid transport system ATPase component [Paenibacillus sp. V4I9]|uniref:ABC transporter ATP-binding protein n=1 Tax=Paenibacillus sp. V4I9 TaxID=3042308 RepID=UPI0027851E03|nr:ABC transporter ATP-binding protein [Paenibacillus sp. V4I9]MDQ0889820.1 ABC-type branched-subunit amino acid transport system ATPase component [Paenibacillus sp. V4I9]
MSFLRMRNVTSGYGKTLILRNIELEIGRGEIVCLIGRNGVGKTTLLKTIIGEIVLTEGEISLEDQPIHDLKPYQIAGKGVAYAPQEKGIFFDLTVLQNLKVGCNLPKSSFEEACIEVFLSFPVLGERLSQRAGTLSGGEKKMLMMARAIIQKPKLLVLDEITEGVQPSIIEKISAALKRLNQLGTTVLMVEQNINFAVQIAHVCAVINQGQIIEVQHVDESTKKRLEQYLVI